MSLTLGAPEIFAFYHPRNAVRCACLWCLSTAAAAIVHAAISSWVCNLRVVPQGTDYTAALCRAVLSALGRMRQLIGYRVSGIDYRDILIFIDTRMLLFSDTIKPNTICTISDYGSIRSDIQHQYRGTYPEFVRVGSPHRLDHWICMFPHACSAT